MTRRPWISETVHSCVKAQDGRFLVITNTGKHAVSPHELKEGAKVSIRVDGSAVAKADGNVRQAASLDAEQAVKPLQAIDRIRGQE